MIDIEFIKLSEKKEKVRAINIVYPARFLKQKFSYHEYQRSKQEQNEDINSHTILKTQQVRKCLFLEKLFT